MGRPKIHIDINEVERLAGLGLSEEQIAINCGIHYNTLLERKKQYPEYQEAIKRGKAGAISKVTNRLMDKAMEGDTTAMIFWLKNRDRKEWRDKHDLEHSGGMDNTITIVDPGCGHVGPTETDQS